MSLNRWVLLAFRAAVGGVFLWAGTLKLLDPLAFARGIEAYRIFPRPVAFFLAMTLPAVEVACGAFLVLGLLRRPAALLASAMSAGFILLVAVTMIRGLDVSCGCFGSFSGRAGPWLLLQDIFLLGMSLSVLLSRKDPLSLDGLRARRK